MKRLFTTAALVIVAAFALHAQESKERIHPEISAGYGFIPTLGCYLFHWNGQSWIDMDPDIPDNLETLYGNDMTDTWNFGFSSLSAELPLMNWLSVPFTFTWALNFTRVSDSFNNRSRVMADASLGMMAGVKFKYLKREKFNLYSSLHAGLGLTNVGHITGTPNAELVPAFQIVPIGVTVGGSVFGFAEVGVGTVYFGGHAGVGYRF